MMPVVSTFGWDTFEEVADKLPPTTVRSPRLADGAEPPMLLSSKFWTVLLPTKVKIPPPLIVTV